MQGWLRGCCLIYRRVSCVILFATKTAKRWIFGVIKEKIVFNFQVCTEGRLILEFTFDDMMRIKAWHFAIRTYKEFIPRNIVNMTSQQDPNLIDTISKNITRNGITNSTLNYLRVSRSRLISTNIRHCVVVSRWKIFEIFSKSRKN